MNILYPDNHNRGLITVIDIPSVMSESVASAEVAISPWISCFPVFLILEPLKAEKKVKNVKKSRIVHALNLQFEPYFKKIMIAMAYMAIFLCDFYRKRYWLPG